MNIQFISHLISNIGCSAMIAFCFIKIDRANIIIKSKAKTKKDIIALVLGYFIYGKIVDRIFGSDDTKITPAKRLADGVDYMEMSWPKAFLIQFLNIAGTGPIFGAVAGAL